ncbi:MAG: IS66 family transposase [Sandaracinaceae bacterium]|nr:IS66 family transposase [Sandaracinaceae bacterium]
MLESFLVQTDDTGLKVLDRGHPGNVKRGFLWVHVGDGRHCYVLYTPNKEYADEPNPALEYLKLREGYIQADAFPGYDTVFAAPGSRAIEVGCWMHGRRYYVTALDAGELLAAYPLKLIKGMYKVERDATEKGVSPEQRLEMRLERSGPLRNELGHWIADNHPKVRRRARSRRRWGTRSTSGTRSAASSKTVASRSTTARRRDGSVGQRWVVATISSPAPTPAPIVPRSSTRSSAAARSTTSSRGRT